MQTRVKYIKGYGYWAQFRRSARYNWQTIGLGTQDEFTLDPETRLDNPLTEKEALDRIQKYVEFEIKENFKPVYLHYKEIPENEN